MTHFRCLSAPCLVSLLLAACAGQVEPDAPSDDGPTPIDRYALRRLSAIEFERTIQHLVGTTQTFAEDLPADDVSHGFNRVADALSVSPLHVELYERAASRVVSEILLEPLESPIDEQVAGSSCGQPFNGRAYGPSSHLEHLTALWSWQVPTSGTYRLSVTTPTGG